MGIRADFSGIHRHIENSWQDLDMGELFLFNIVGGDDLYMKCEPFGGCQCYVSLGSGRMYGEHGHGSVEDVSIIRVCAKQRLPITKQ